MPDDPQPGVEVTHSVNVTLPPHKGQLWVGERQKPGGRGAVPSVIRNALRGSFAQRVDVLEQIADGEAVAKSVVSLSDVMPYLCVVDGKIWPLDGLKASEIEIPARVSATPKERIAAIDILAKYGLGQLKEVSVEAVRERVGRTLELIRVHCPADVASRLLTALRPIWTE